MFINTQLNMKIYRDNNALPYTAKYCAQQNACMYAGVKYCTNYTYLKPRASHVLGPTTPSS